MKKILFMGTPDFAVPSLRALKQAGYEVTGVVTQQDKPKGRGHKLTPPPVKECALEYGIPVFQPQSLKNGALLPQLEEAKPDLIVVVAYGKVLPKYILDYPQYGCVNVHASLLPKYRGAGPIQWSVINGEEKTGVTTMYMAEGLDTGDMILKEETVIDKDETAGQLHDRLSSMGATLLIETLTQIFAGTAPREKQDDSLSCYAPMIDKETGHIDWTASAETILNLIRGTNPWPVGYANYQGESMKIFRGEKGPKGNGVAGEILAADKKGILVACGNGETILVKEIQQKGSKRMEVASFLNGHSICVGEILK